MSFVMSGSTLSLQEENKNRKERHRSKQFFMAILFIVDNINLIIESKINKYTLMS